MVPSRAGAPTATFRRSRTPSTRWATPPTTSLPCYKPARAVPTRTRCAPPRPTPPGLSRVPTALQGLMLRRALGPPGCSGGGGGYRERVDRAGVDRGGGAGRCLRQDLRRHRGLPGGRWGAALRQVLERLRRVEAGDDVEPRAVRCAAQPAGRWHLPAVDADRQGVPGRRWRRRVPVVLGVDRRAPHAGGRGWRGDRQRRFGGQVRAPGQAAGQRNVRPGLRRASGVCLRRWSADSGELMGPGRRCPPGGRH